MLFSHTRCSFRCFCLHPVPQDYLHQPFGGNDQLIASRWHFERMQDGAAYSHHGALPSRLMPVYCQALLSYCRLSSDCPLYDSTVPLNQAHVSRERCKLFPEFVARGNPRKCREKIFFSRQTSTYPSDTPLEVVLPHHPPGGLPAWRHARPDCTDCDHLLSHCGRLRSRLAQIVNLHSSFRI